MKFSARNIFFLILFLISFNSKAASNRPEKPNYDDILPPLTAYAKALTPENFHYFLSNIVEFLQGPCTEPKKTNAVVAKHLQEACLLEKAYSHLKTLEETIASPETSPFKLPSDLIFPPLDLIQSGAWRRNLMVKNNLKKFNSPYSLATELILTKIVIQKSLASYVKLADIWSRYSSNTARVYLVPKLVQALQGRTILGSLYDRYKAQNCSIEQMLARPGSNLCQIEKARTAFLIRKLYEASQTYINSAIHSLKIVQTEGDQSDIQQLGQLVPLAESIEELKKQAITATEIWNGIGNTEFVWKKRLESNFRSLTTFPIQLLNSEQVSAYVFSSAILTIHGLTEMYEQIKSVSGLYADISPQTEFSKEFEAILTSSKQEILLNTSAISYFLESQESEQE